MKILFTAGGTGGHFYPIIAVAEAIIEIEREEHLIEPQLFYAAPHPYDRDMLTANGIKFVPTAAGKQRPYFSILNFIDYFKTAWGVTRSIFRIFFLYPDVVFGKGGYASFPTLLAAKLFHIPVVIHESDAVPGRVNIWAGKFAQKIAISFEESASYFPPEKTVLTGNPIRNAALHPSKEGAHEFLKLEQDIPIILIVGGSQGAQALNEVVLSALPQLIEKYQVVHQCGEANVKDIAGRATVAIGNSPYRDRYKPFGYLNDLALRMSYGSCSLIISRAGSTLFEIAANGIPSILVPLPSDVAHADHQTKNAYAYARSGAGVVIEQNNLTPGILFNEADRILTHKDLSASMSAAAKKFARVDAARAIAQMILQIGLSHES